MTINASPDINIFDFNVIYDLTGATPVVKINNLSEGPNLAALDYWFVLTSPSGVVYHLGSEGTPDKSGVWNTEWTVPEPIPQIQGHIDWSGSEYKVKGYVKDSTDAIYSTDDADYTTKICRPNGNKTGQKNNFGAAKMNVCMNCAAGTLFVEDKTNYSYNGITGERLSKTTMLVFPIDDTDNIPEPFVENDTNASTIPITYSGKNYQLILDAVYEYDYGNNTFVRIKYKYKACFEIACGTQLCTILCWLAKYEKELEEGGCTPSQRDRLMIIISKLVRAIGGIMQPLCGIDIGKLVAEIKAEIGDCGDCESEGRGINPQGNCATPIDLVVE